MFRRKQVLLPSKHVNPIHIIQLEQIGVHGNRPRCIHGFEACMPGQFALSRGAVLWKHQRRRLLFWENMSQRAYHADLALLPEGWRRDVRLTVDSDGFFLGVAPADTPGEASRLAGPVVPGMPNLHSHAFQRAMAGLTERAGPGEDSFWTWRDVMYRFVERLGPEHVGAIAAQLYVEMLKAGYTAVGEFHYLHHRPDGGPYDNLAELSHRVLAAARQTGIGLTHLPVLYGYGGFGGAAAGRGQRRFLNDPQRFLALVEEVRETAGSDPQIAVGIAPHSLRAVTPETLRAVLAGLGAEAARVPVHIHVAEQTREVEECLAWSGRRPVAWLLDECPVGSSWCLVHATHIDEAEVEALARCGAVAGLCPTTEANLADGLFPAGAFLDAGGRFGIGSDSHVSVSPLEELRWLEYGQRLTHRRRNLLAAEPGSSLGRRLYEGALAGGAQALGRPIGRLQEGSRADLLVLDPDCPSLVGHGPKTLLDALVFAGNHNPVKDVMVGGRWVVREGRHDAEDAVLAAYRRATDQLGGA